MKTSDIFLKHVVPALGTLIAIGMYASPLMAVLRVRTSRILGELNPLPFPLAYANSVGWVAYSMVLRDGYVFAPNGVGAMLGLFNTLSTIPYARPKLQNWMNFIVVGGAGLIMFMGAGTVITGIDHNKLKLIWGSVAVSVQTIYYSSPLTTMRQVITQRDSSTLYWPLCLMNLLCASLWFCYGMAIKDLFIGVPNGVGTALSLTSLAFCFIFPRKAEAARSAPGLKAGQVDAGAPAIVASAASAAAPPTGGALQTASSAATKDEATTRGARAISNDMRQISDDAMEQGLP